MPTRSVCGNSADASTNPLYTTNDNFTFVKSQQDWEVSGRGTATTGTNQLPAGSWEARVVRRALRLNNFDPASAVTGNVIGVNEIAATNIAWRVDVHYRTCASGQVP